MAHWEPYNRSTWQRWVNEHSDVNKQWEPAKHVRKHPDPKPVHVGSFSHCPFMVEKENKGQTFYIARFPPELNKQVQSLDLTVFPLGTRITYLHGLNCKNTERMQIISLWWWSNRSKKV